ncbi:MAG: branched chain amino acid aminotransferase, partial [Clostridia bacterium]|nr:branched chain amino acid aminotransferase [Clostridia bacterium]
DKAITINNNEIGTLSQKLYDTITGIQTGKVKDEFDWIVEI